MDYFSPSFLSFLEGRHAEERRGMYIVFGLSGLSHAGPFYHLSANMPPWDVFLAWHSSPVYHSTFKCLIYRNIHQQPTRARFWGCPSAAQFLARGRTWLRLPRGRVPVCGSASPGRDVGDAKRTALLTRVIILMVSCGNQSHKMGAFPFDPPLTG